VADESQRRDAIQQTARRLVEGGLAKSQAEAERKVRAAVVKSEAQQSNNNK